MKKRLYTAFSLFEFIWSLLLKLACVLGLFFSLAHYDENPSLITIVSALCILLIFIIGDDQITVYQDRVTQKTNSFSSLIFRSSGTTFKIEKIKFAYLQSLPRSAPIEIGAAVILSAILPRKNSQRDKTQPIFFELKGGETVKLDTNLENDKMKKIVELVNSLTTYKIAGVCQIL